MRKSSTIYRKIMTQIINKRLQIKIALYTLLSFFQQTQKFRTN